MKTHRVVPNLTFDRDQNWRLTKKGARQSSPGTRRGTRKRQTYEHRTKVADVLEMIRAQNGTYCDVLKGYLRGVRRRINPKSGNVLH